MFKTFETKKEKKINQIEREAGEKLFKLFVKYFKEVELPHLIAMAEIYKMFDKIKCTPEEANESLRKYMEELDGRKNRHKKPQSKK